MHLNSAQRRGTWFSTEVKEIAQEQGSHLPRPPTSRGISDQRDQRSNQTSEKNNATDRLSGAETSAFIAKLRGELAPRFTTKLLGLDWTGASSQRSKMVLFKSVFHTTHAHSRPTGCFTLTPLLLPPYTENIVIYGLLH